MKVQKNSMAIDLIATSASNIIATRWRTLKLYNAYRLVVALLVLAMQDMLNNDAWLQNASTDFFSALALGYFVFSIVSTAFTWFEKPNININLPIQILLDIVFIVLMMHAQNGSQSSIGLLLIIAIASASLISEGRFALFYAAIASIGILLEQSYRILELETFASSYTPAVLLCLGCFATAWLAYSLAKRAKESELLASQRGLDVQNLAQINALITHEMQDGVLVVGEDFRIKHHNMQAEKLLGMESNYGEPTNWQGRALTEVSPEIATLMRLWLEETEPVHGFVSTNSAAANFLKLTALSRELRLRFLPISESRAPDSRKQGAVIFISDWSQMQTQAHQVKLAALGRLTANIAHEIRNPLSAISHANQLLQEEDSSQSTKRMLQIISDNVQRVDQIIKDVLELNRRDRTNQEILHLENFMLDFYSQFCAVEKIPSASFKLRLINSDTLISFDRRHLNQILWNLCKNGWRHCKKLENSLELALALTGNTKNVQIEINDDGEGIPESARSHLFEPFFTTEKSGTGLGLYIARELADANGAKLLYKMLNPKEESGSQFIMHVKKA
jgi:two-component system, NtrC family, sensor histidine kinase PilS